MSYEKEEDERSEINWDQLCWWGGAEYKREEIIVEEDVQTVKK
jgi:hypothetical protein